MLRSAIVVAAIVLLPCVAAAQAKAAAPTGADLLPTEEEALAMEQIELERFVSARETAEGIVEERPTSIIGHLALGLVQRYGEGNLPRSLYHLRRARSLLERRWGPAPLSPGAVRWHGRILQETAFTCGEMERYEEELELWDRYDSLYQPQMPGERIWPLMMLRRFDEARLWAIRAMDSGNNWARRQALNGLCAIENEAGNRLLSHRWCTAHAQEVWDFPGAGAVYMCNAAESARGIFRLDEAERYYLEAARRDVAWYANPWMHLADLYLRAGRIAQSLAAVRNMHEYARRRPPHTQQQDAAERTRTVASLLVIAGRPRRALELTERAVRFPDRRGGQSRSPEADHATAALLHRRALLDSAEVEIEEAVGSGFFARVGASFRAAWLRARGWRAGRRAVALVDDEEVLRGLLEAEGRMSQGTPPWLAAELVEVAGPGPVGAALEQARASLPVEGLAAYLDAYEAEAAAASSDWERADAAAARAVRDLPTGEALLRARAQLLRARASEAAGRHGEAAGRYVEVLQVDAPLLRRARWSLPVRLEAATDSEVARRVARALRRSPRVRSVPTSPLVLGVEGVDGGCRVCLASATGGEIACARAAEGEGGDVDESVRACLVAFHDQVLGARLDMSLLDPSALDGSTTSGGSVDDVLTGTTGP